MDSALTRHRILLAIGATAIPALGVARAVFKPDAPDSMAIRLALAGAFVVALVGSFRIEAFERHLQLITVGLCHVVHVWLLFYLGALWGFDHDAAIATVVAIAAMMTSFARWREVLSFGLLHLAGTAFAYSVGPDDVFPMPVFLIMSTAIILAGGGGNVARSQLERLLAEANTDLENRVADRTAELEAEVEQRARAEAAAEQASRAKSTFLANMSHELRTPLNAVIGYTEMVRDELAEESDDRSADLERALGSAHHLLGIIDDVLDLSRIESGRLHLHVDEVPLGPVVEEAIQVVRPLADERGNTVAFEGTDVRAKTDPARVRQILVALLDNAARFTRDGEIRIAVASDHAGARLEVHDTGIGIPEHELPHVFDRFRQVDGSPTREHGGTGLGLALCRELTGHLGGQLSVQSTVGSGSTFTLSLP